MAKSIWCAVQALLKMKQFPELNAQNFETLKEKAQQWSLANGLVMYPANYELYQANGAPITLFPTPIPRQSFQKAVDVQTIYNKLYARVVGQELEWLDKQLEKFALFDEGFTGKLFELYRRLLAENNGKPKQPLSLGIFRSDYMLHEGKEIKQIEFNTVSVSFGGLSPKVGELHTYLNQSGSYDDSYSYKYYDDDEIPISQSIIKISEAIAKGNETYGVAKNAILFIVQPNERNSFDQRHIEYELLKTHGLKSFRLTLGQVLAKTTVNGGKLYYKSTMDEISVVYYRSGYAPTDYVDESCWEARYFLENNTAIKSPSLKTQLSGSKKIQQVLTNEDVLKKFIPDSHKDISDTFVKIYALDDSDQGKLAKKLAFETPEKFVLKPQREGGGNNIYKEDIPGFLKSIDENSWGAYILMELINPPIHKNCILRNNEILNDGIMSELGIFGSAIFNETNGDILYNEYSGFLLRSKLSTSNEGGVAAGFGCVDGVYLY